MPRELADEAALAEPRVRDDRHDLQRRRRAGSLEDADDRLELEVAADEWRRLGDELRAGPGNGSHRSPAMHRLGTTLQGQLARVLPGERRRGGPVGRLADENPVDDRLGLEPGRDIEGVAGREAFAGSRVQVGPDQGLAGHDPDPDVDRQPGRRDLVDQPERGPDGALGVVLVRDG